MLALILDERLGIWPSIGEMVSAKPKVENNIIQLNTTVAPGIDIGGIQKIYEMQYKNFFGYAYSLTFSRDISSDIVQTVFAKLVSKIKKSGAIEVDNFEAYVIRAIRNEYVDRKRKELKQPNRLSMVSDESPSAEHDHLNAQSNQDLQDAIEKLPTAQRTCIVLYYFNELNSAAISKELEISISAVKTHLQRARKTLANGDLTKSEGEFR
ncbi:MAG TPA: RNA polymerase sigma factor [Acidimicrobiia bacterium]|nr:RNA polymerase sigma factor [Acidimicrobiia bacterium]